MFNETKYSEKKDFSFRGEPDPIFSVLLLLGAISLGLGMLFNGLSESAKLSRLPTHKAEIGNSEFTEINMVPGVTLFSHNGHPIKVAGDDILFVGYLKQGNDDYVPGRAWNPDLALFSLDLVSGSINWQAEAEPQSVIVNEDKVFVILDSETPGNGKSVVAYDAFAGKQVWRTQFDSLNAIGVDSFAASRDTLFVRTFHRSTRGFYVLDARTGNVLSVLEEDIESAFFADDDLSTMYFLEQHSVISSGANEWSTQIITHCGHCKLVDPVITDKMILVRNWGSPYHGFLYVLDRYTGEVLWHIEEHIISNVAIEGKLAYFLTANAEFFAVDIETGTTVTTLNFSPKFPDGFDFQNAHFLVAVNDDTVATYFGDSRQLFLLSLK